MGNAIVEIILILGLLIINGIFAMSELALISSRKIRRIEERRRMGA